MLHLLILEERLVPSTLQVGPGAFSTIQAAVNAASPGDTVLVAHGTYREDVVIDKPLNLIGQPETVATSPPQNPFLVGPGGAAGTERVLTILNTSGSVLVQNFAIGDSHGSQLNQIGVWIGGVNDTLDHSVVRKVRDPSAVPAGVGAPQTVGIEIAGAQNATISFTSIYEVHNPPNGGAAFGIKVADSDGVLIHHCYAKNIDTANPGAGGSVGLAILDSTNVVLTEFATEQLSADDIGIYIDNSMVTMDHVKVYGVSVGLRVDGPSAVDGIDSYFINNAVDEIIDPLAMVNIS
jgi:hypothetical protein